MVWAEKVVFSNSIIIATSNAGANLIREGLVGGSNLDDLKGKLLNFLQDENIFSTGNFSIGLTG